MVVYPQQCVFSNTPLINKKRQIGQHELKIGFIKYYTQPIIARDGIHL